MFRNFIWVRKIVLNFHEIYKLLFRKEIIVYLCLTIGTYQTQAQSTGLQINNNKKYVSIPFEYINGFMVVDVIFNQTFPLKFIFDTGASNTIISRKEIIQLFNLPIGRTFKVYGADLSTVLYAHLVKSVHLSTGGAIAPTQDILVLEEDYFNFQRLTGMEIHGVLGADMFARYKVKINYRNKTIALYESKVNKPNIKDYQAFEMKVQKSKPYIVCKTTLANDTILEAKLLIDTGASTALLLNTKTDKSLTLPDKIIPGNLGFGLGGVLEGYVGRVPCLEFGSHKLENIVCRFQEVEPPKDSLSLVFRNGIIGNFILDRFLLVIDYPNQQLYIKPDKKWRRKFTFDRSGISFISVGLANKTYYVNSVLNNSPAFHEGIKSGDILLNINRKPCTLLSYDKINRLFRGKAGKTIRLRVKRGNEKIKVEFKLKDLI